MKNLFGHPPFFCFLFFVSSILRAAESGPFLPVISQLDSRDIAFRQFIEDVEASRRVLFTGRAAPESLASFLTVYVYTPAESEDILQVAARCSLPYESIATLNRISHPEDFKTGEAMFLPSVPGLFIPDTPG
ncbi:MAG: M23 family peptidase, partial [Treponema sp.]|nr:M23 family peptidase [Treponema sp.]